MREDDRGRASYYDAGRNLAFALPGRNVNRLSRASGGVAAGSAGDGKRSAAVRH
ncbi:hypothetical protein QB714_003814 [Salmonella enterica]|nr:hypothetical protein [Salmonella enterica]EKS4720098.1 hypothetical protein [Salmonella enterica]EKS4724554.1 hypothetical protein [Salmonella enterica]EKS4738108.1 hypothetical protein [Salmonella enterica]EKS4961679.1 hypothetical protein [Salmonella enterica]